MFLGIIVDFAVPYIPLSWENALSAPIMSEVNQMGTVSRRYEIAKIQNLLDSLAKLMPKEQQRSFKVVVVDKKETNALALPGGNIVLFSELLNEVQSENELAMILAHELGHFAHRDHLRGLGRSFLFYMFSALLLGGDNATARTFMNSSGILTNTYSRSQEAGADRFALDLIIKKYGHAGGTLDFFRRLAGKETLPELTHYLSTHPASKKRVAALQEIIDEKELAVGEPLPVFWLKGEKSP
jgi:predicted Zn-dependent protease